MVMSRALSFVCLVAAFGSICDSAAVELTSPCPDVFRYDSTENAKNGQWSGTLTLLSDSDLRGIWVRVLFDREITELTVDDNFATVVNHKGATEFLVKNPEKVLSARVPTSFKINVKYETVDGKVPRLIDYRLNAKSVCAGSDVFFPSDARGADYLQSLLASNKPFAYEEFPGCGSTPLFQDAEIKAGKGKDGQFPWQASLFNKVDYICEATLISSRHLLLPAHCVAFRNSRSPADFTGLTVYLGRSINSGESGNTQKFGVDKITLYPGYNSNSLLNDLAIIRLKKAVTVNDYVRPICLGAKGRGEESALVGFTSGESQELAATKVKILHKEECEKDKSDLLALLTDSSKCAKLLDNSVCVGSSGSSVASPRRDSKNIWELKGIVTVGAALQNLTCDKDPTFIILNVSKYSRWIQAEIFWDKRQ